MFNSHSRPKLFPLFIIAVGVVWLLNNLGFTRLDLKEIFITYWPLLLVIWGIDILGRNFPGNDGRKAGTGIVVTGLILIGLGLAIVARNLGYFDYNFSQLWGLFWAVLLILLGFAILKRPSMGAGRTRLAIMSGLEMKYPGWKLSAGSWLTIMGGVELDLTVAEIPPGEITLNLTAIMGGIDIRIPRGMGVDCQGTAILGGVDFLHQSDGGIIASNHVKREGTGEHSSTLVINALAVLGGIEIKE
ncbi:MAG: LiaF transmembrane domain-containing protein [Bacillota bacterium]